MTRWHEALEMIIGGIAPAPAIKVPMDGALGLTASEDVLSPEMLPPFDNSAMDGYAVISSDCEGASAESPVSLQILEDLPAGRVAARALSPGTAMRIMTGAALPPGCDAVVPLEDALPGKGSVEILKAAKPKGNVRFAGEGMGEGQAAIMGGELIRPAHIGLLAALGITEIYAFPPVKVAVITTGSELVGHAERPAAGQIRDANLHSLSAQIRSWGALPLAFPRIADARGAVESALGKAADGCDLLLTTGGVSVGDYDFVKGALEAMGAKMHFWRVAQKPGGPLGFWTLRGKPLFGIPGNPVSAMVMAELYLKPAVRKMMGHKNVAQPPVLATLEGGYRKSRDDGKRHFLRVFAEEKKGGWAARLSGPQGSAQMASMCAANALAMIPEDALEIPPGGEVGLLLM